MKKDSKGIFDQFFNNNIDLLCIADINGHFLKLNSEWEKTLGYSLSEMEGKPYIEFIHEEDLDNTIAATNQLLHNKQNQTFVNRFRHKDGSYRWIEWRSFPSEGKIYSSARDITERIKAESDLKSSEKKFLKAFMHYPDMVSVIDSRTFKYIDVNELFTKKYGYQRSEIIGRTSIELDLWNNLDDRDRMIKLLKKNGFVRNFETKHKISNGEIRDYIITGEIIEAYKEKCYLLFTRDITEEKRSAKALRESETRLRSFIDKSSEGVVILNENGIVEEWNNSAELITGVPRQDIINKFWLEAAILIFPNLMQSDTIRNQIEKEINVALLTGEVNLEPHNLPPFQLPTGKIKFLEQKIFTIKTELGYRVAGIFIDITERRETEKLIADDHNILRALVNNIPDIVYVKDTQSRFVITNSTLATILNTTVENLIGKTDLELFPSGIATKFYEDEQLLVQTGTPIINKEETILNPLGNAVILQTTKIPLRDTSGNITGIVGTGHIITEQKQYEEALKKRLLALTKPLDDPEGIKFTDLFNIEELQKIQDTFAEATGVASLITYSDGTPITNPSNFCSLCKMIRSTEKGKINCLKSDAHLGNMNAEGPTIMPCLSGGLWDAGASITLGGRHLANWFIGQIRNETLSDSELLKYAGEIGADFEQFKKALQEVPHMTIKQFEKVSQSLFVLAKELSDKAYQNVQQARFISEQKKAEEALRKSEAQIKGIAQNIPGIVYQFYADENGRLGLNYISENALHYLGISSKDLDKVYYALFEGIIKEDRVRLISSIKNAIATVSPWEFESKFNKHDGSTILFRGEAKPRMLDNKLVYDGILLDITQSRKAEQELSDTRAMLATSLMQTPVPMVIVSMPDNIIRLANSACAKILGYGDESDFIGKSLSDLDQTWQDFDERGNIISLSDTPLALALRGIETKNREFFIKRKDGTIRWNSVSSSVVRNSSGEIIAGFLVFPDITERKQAEEKIRQQAALHQTILDTVPVGVIFEKERKIQWTNDAFCRMYGYEFAEIYEADISIIYPSDEDYKRIGIESYPLLGNGGVYSTELPGKKKDGTLFMVNLSGKAVNPEKSAEGSIWMLQDITERKKNEEIIHLSEQKFRSIFENSTVGIALVGLDGKYLMVNQALCQIMGYNSHELTKIDFFQLTHPEDIDMSRNTLETITNNSKRIFTFSKRYIHKEGRVIWTEVSSRLIHDEKDNPLYFITHINDISERKIAENHIRESEEKFRIAFENAPSGMTMIKPDGEYVALNPMICKIFGYTKEELISGKINLNTHPDDVERSYQWIRKVISGDMSEPEFEKRYIHKDGHIIWGLVRSQWIRNDDGTPRISVTHILDITERKKAEADILALNQELEKKVEERTNKLNEAIKELEAFAYSVSHDLRAPIRHISGFTRLMFSIIPEPSDQIIDYYTKIETASKRMSSMVDSLLSFSRLGRKELSISELDLKVIVSEVIEQFTPDIEKREIEWKISRLPIIQGDKNLIKLVFENLISNAIKYTSKQSKAIIEIGSTNEGTSQYELYVKDNGVGFDMLYVNKLFGVFQRLHTSEEFEGIGIGLANVKQIIEKHKGSIRAEGKYNEGAVFYITLPKK